MVANEWRDLHEYDVRPVRGVEHDIHRARVGDYRVFFLLSEPYIAVLHVDQREGAYGNPGRLGSRVDDFFP
jgi:mRNA-degrading endonuclease RelE of RelBE toxin-antitoxin system